MSVEQGVNLDKMKQSPIIYGNTDYSEVDDVEIDETKIFWMGTNANLSDTPQEQLENRLAIKQQYERGILDEFGLPTGFTWDELNIPKEKQEEMLRLKKERMGIPQQHVAKEEKKVYKNKFERKKDRETLRREEKMREKLDRANKIIAAHQVNPYLNKK
jgi:hypothetical protein